MKKFLFSLIILILSVSEVSSQIQVCLGMDAVACPGQTVQITNCGGAGGAGSTIVLNSPTTIPQLSDDSFSGAIPIGFTFNFYGANNTQCVIGSNGLVSFNMANANAYCPYTLTGAGTLPSANLTATRNSVMLTYSDMNPSQTPIGSIQYQTLGTAPNRKFVVLYQNINAFSCLNTCYYTALILYETSNVVEVMIGQKPSCPSWNGGLAIEGLNSPSGATAHIITGRNNSVWTANQDGRRFTPTAPNVTTNYTMAQIPYSLVTGTGGQTNWVSTTGQTYPYNNGVLNITTIPATTTGYYISTSACNTSVGSVGDTTFISPGSIGATSSTTTDYCNSGLGSATANPTQGNPPFTYTWTPTNANTQTIDSVTAGNYTLTVTDANGCSTNLPVVVPNTNATFSATSTVVNCPGGSDGTATATMNPVLGTVTYQWDDANAQTTQTATGLSAGVYNCTVTSSTGCVGTATVTVSEIPPMVATQQIQQDATCNSGNDGILGFQVTGGTAPYSYTWNSSTSMFQVANDLFAGTHTINITDSNGCVITASGTIGEPAPLSITYLTPNLIICEESDTTLSVQGSGGSSAYTFTWTENGVPIGTGSSIVVDPLYSGYVYCVTLSEACGSPTTDSCLTITFPVPIIPTYAPDKSVSCVPGVFNFMNTSNNQNEIDSTVVQFGDGTSGTFSGASGFTHTYPNPQSYSLNMVVTSIYGCVYTNTQTNIVQVFPNPTAEFNFSANPTTFFETNITLQDKSTDDVVQWDWYSPNSVPSSSSQESPTFVYPEGETGRYLISLIVTTAQGCVDTIEHYLVVNSDIIMYAPNSFTPNGDEFNNSWKFSIVGIDETDFELLIFNRWGEVIFETHDIHQGWDGTYHNKIVPSGGYGWIARAKDIYSDKKVEFKGSIQILR